LEYRESDLDTVTSTDVEDRSLIKTGNISLAVEDIDATLGQIDSIESKYDAMKISLSDYGKGIDRRVDITIKVVDDQFEKEYGGTRETGKLLTCVVQGAKYLDLREECAKELVKIGFDGYNFGGYVVDKRVQAMESFWSRGLFDQDGNAQFGEGGAGTFSDGKLTTRIGDHRVRLVLEAFIEHGAHPQISYQKKPHVGTDVIRRVVKSIRQEIIDRGGRVYFQSRLSDIHINQTSVESITINDKARVPCSVLVLAVGNSARDVFRLLSDRGVSLPPKAFAVGVRIEHQQSFIDRTQYGNFAGHPRLGAADYHLTYQDRQAGRSFYTFCMCPGGYVIGAASEAGQIVTNGMSYAARDSGRANSAIVVTVGPGDWGNSALGGVELQERLERRAFQLGGGDYRAPAQLVQDFLEHRSSISLKGSLATFKPGVNAVNLWELFPPELCQVMERGLHNWERKMPGFTSGPAILTGVETRTSSPLRIARGDNLNSISLDNLYPCGE